VGSPSASVRGRFAPSPTGPLHAGSLVAALASWLDVRARGGRWLVRIEDVDTPRCSPAAADRILAQLAACGLTPDEPVVWQSQRTADYDAALESLVANGRVYRCRCSRADVDRALAALGRLPDRHEERVYPGTCRDAGWTDAVRSGWRLRIGSASGGDVVIDWHDRRLGRQSQNLTRRVGDFILRRSDGLWAYQIAVVVDDAAQGITDVVRGEDLADNTARQIHLQRALGLPTPHYLHTPLVLAADGQKLSKQTGARPLDLADPVRTLAEAGQVLGLPAALVDVAHRGCSISDWLSRAVQAWAAQIGFLPR
jgi:glutamyl-Q tRNA(Asp) synthetase